jgi:putative transposase
MKSLAFGMSTQRYNRMMKTLESSVKFSVSDPASLRLKVLEHGSKYGWESATDAFGVSRASYFRWKKIFKSSRGHLASLVPKSTRPKRVRQMGSDYRLVEFIKQMRDKYGNLGREKIKVFLDEYALELGITSLSSRTIGKIIQRRHLFDFPKRKYKRRSLPSKVRSRYAPKVKSPGYIEVDSVVLNVLNCRHYFVCLIDVFTKIAFVKKVPSHASIHARDALLQFIQTLPFTPLVVQTDNGSEFLDTFDSYLKTQGITHCFTYPRCPKVNGVIERFNRTLQEEFISRSDSLYYDISKFNDKLSLWLTWYNTKRPHAALDYLSPKQFLQVNSLK